MALKSQQRLEQIKKVLDINTVVDVAYDAFVKNTPVRSGNARKSTAKGPSEINAKYAYAKRLNNGYSKQSPDGMVNPTITAIRAYIKKNLG